MVDSAAANHSYVIQNLLQKADEATQQPFGPNSAVTIVGENQYATANVFNTAVSSSSDQNGLKIEEVDEATANQILQTLAPPTAYQQSQVVDTSSAANAVVEIPPPPAPVTLNSDGELFQDPNPPQVIRRPAVQGPITYRQNISVRFLQPPPLPPPGPLIIKEVRPPQPPAPRPLVVRQRAAALPTPPPLVLRERPPQGPPPIPSQTIIKKLPAIPVPPRSVIIERYPSLPQRPRDVIIERWLSYSKEPQKRKVITYRAPPARPYPQPRNTIIVYEPVQAKVVRAVQKLGVSSQNPQEYVLRYGNTLLDTATLLAQIQNIGLNEDLNAPFTVAQQQQQQQQYQTDVSEYYLDTAETVSEPQYEYSTKTVESEPATSNEQVQVFWTDPNEDLRVILQRLGLTVE